MQSCPECKDKTEGDSSLSAQNSNTGKKRHIACDCCGKPVDDDLAFCNYCGAERLFYDNAKQANAAVCHSVPADAAPVTETEFFRHNAAIYLRGLVPAHGSLVVTSDEIRFTPQVVYRFLQPLVIGFDLIAEVSYGSIAGLGFEIRILLKSGVTHKFSLGVVPDAGEISEVLQRLNVIVKNG